jgi:hypothetical protein
MYTEVDWLFVTTLGLLHPPATTMQRTRAVLSEPKRCACLSQILRCGKYSAATIPKSCLRRLLTATHDSTLTSSPNPADR